MTCSARERRSGETAEEYRKRLAIESRMCRIKHKILVLSGKGGVGKSTIAANLAMYLSKARNKVGLLDVDIHGPSIPKLLNLEEHRLDIREGSIQPGGFRSLKVVSIGFLIPDKDDAVIWRGPRKMGMIRQFLTEVEWGDLDYLLIDCPPGTGDEPLSVVQLIENVSGAVVVTSPQALAVQDVRRCITFCRSLRVRVLGVVENMSGFTCPHCGQEAEIFGAGGGERMAAEMGVSFLGRIPMDPWIRESGDAGRPFSVFGSPTPARDAFAELVHRLEEVISRPSSEAFEVLPDFTSDKPTFH